MSSSIILYFSCTGETKKVAEKLKRSLECDLAEIVPRVSYTGADLNWNDHSSRCFIESHNRESRPEVRPLSLNPKNYDKIYLGFPIWWGVAPRVINTFIEANDLSNKDIYIFVTSGGSGCEYALEDLKKHYSNLNFVSARRFNGMEDNDDYKKFVRGGV